MEDHTTTDSTLEILNRLRVEFPTTGAVLQSYLRRTEGDCRELSGPGSRVRLCKGAYKEPETVAYQSKLDVDLSYVRCLNVLMSGAGYPMLATHDPRLVAIGEDRAKWFDRSSDTFEFQMLYGIRPEEQKRLVEAGYSVRVYVPYGNEWYGYLMRRLAERPANVAFFARALRSTPVTKPATRKWQPSRRVAGRERRQLGAVAGSRAPGCGNRDNHPRRTIRTGHPSHRRMRMRPARSGSAVRTALRTPSHRGRHRLPSCRRRAAARA